MHNNVKHSQMSNRAFLYRVVLLMLVLSCVVFMIFTSLQLQMGETGANEGNNNNNNNNNQNDAGKSHIPRKTKTELQEVEEQVREARKIHAANVRWRRQRRERGEGNFFLPRARAEKEEEEDGASCEKEEVSKLPSSVVFIIPITATLDHTQHGDAEGSAVVDVAIANAILLCQRRRSTTRLALHFIFSFTALPMSLPSTRAAWASRVNSQLSSVAATATSCVAHAVYAFDNIGNGRNENDEKENEEEEEEDAAVNFYPSFSVAVAVGAAIEASNVIVVADKANPPAKIVLCEGCRVMLSSAEGTAATATATTDEFVYSMVVSGSPCTVLHRQRGESGLGFRVLHHFYAPLLPFSETARSRRSVLFPINTERRWSNNNSDSLAHDGVRLRPVIASPQCFVVSAGCGANWRSITTALARRLHRISEEGKQEEANDVVDAWAVQASPQAVLVNILAQCPTAIASNNHSVSCSSAPRWPIVYTTEDQREGGGSSSLFAIAPMCSVQDMKQPVPLLLPLPHLPNTTTTRHGDGPKKRASITLLWDFWCCKCCGFSAEVQQLLLSIRPFFTSSASQSQSRLLTTAAPTCFCPGCPLYQLHILQSMHLAVPNSAMDAGSGLLSPDELQRRRREWRGALGLDEDDDRAKNRRTRVLVVHGDCKYVVEKAMRLIKASREEEEAAGDSAPVFNRVIGRVMFEFTRVPQWWVEPCNSPLIDEIWVPSESSKQALVLSGVKNGDGKSKQRISIVPETLDLGTFSPPTTKEGVEEEDEKSKEEEEEDADDEVWELEYDSRPPNSNDGNTAVNAPQPPPTEEEEGILVQGFGAQGDKREKSARPYKFLSMFKWEERKGWDVLFRGFFHAFHRRCEREGSRQLQEEEKEGDDRKSDDDTAELTAFTYRWFSGKELFERRGEGLKPRDPIVITRRIYSLAWEDETLRAAFFRCFPELQKKEDDYDGYNFQHLSPCERSDNNRYEPRRGDHAAAAYDYDVCKKYRESFLPRFRIVCDQMAEEVIPVLYSRRDAFVLPTRGEGWGLPLFQSMAMALPTIATNWGGQLEFMNRNNSLLVDVSEMREVPKEGLQYDWAPDMRWAEPSVASLSEKMRWLVRNPEKGRAIGAEARRDIVARFSPQRVGRIVAERLDKFVREEE